MPESGLNEVAQQLLSQSRDHKITWEEASRTGSYRVFFPDIVLAISRTEPSFKLDSDLRLELMSDAGRVIDSLETTLEDDMHSILSQIFELAEQHVRDTGINKALDYLKRT